MLEQNNDKILLSKDDPRRENYEVCLKMIFHDLSELKIKEVDDVLAYYKVGIAENDRISITLPRLVKEKI